MKIHPSFKLFIEDKQIDLQEFPEINFLEPWKKSIQAFILDFTDDRPIVLAQTSGSTGEPKKITLEKEKMQASSKLTGAYFDLKAQTTALLCLSAEYIAGKMMLARAMTLGWQIYCVEPTSNPINGSYDFCAMVPLQAQSSIENLNRIKTIIIGGGVLSKQVEKDLLAINHQGLYQTFGMTETVSHIALKKLGDPLYHTLSDIYVSINKDNCLIINAPSLLKEPLETNDIVELKDKQSFVWLGRKDNVINSGGIKLFPEKIEEKLAPFIQTSFFLYGMPDAKLGQKNCLFIEGESREINLSGAGLNNYEMPKSILFKETFLRTDSGKIRREATVKL